MFLALPTVFTATTLGLLLAFLLIMTGIERLSFAHSMRYYELEGSSAGTVMGIVNIILGVILAFTPLFTGVVLTYLIAAYLIVARCPPSRSGRFFMPFASTTRTQRPAPRRQAPPVPGGCAYRYLRQSSSSSSSSACASRADSSAAARAAASRAASA